MAVDIMGAVVVVVVMRKVVVVVCVGGWAVEDCVRESGFVNRRFGWSGMCFTEASQMHHHRPGIWARFYVQRRLEPLLGASRTGWSWVLA